MRDFNASLEGLRHRAPPLEHRERAFGVRALALPYVQMVGHAHLRQTHHAVRRLNRAFRLGPELVRVTRDPARLQRARQGTGQSARGGADEMVEGARQLLFGFDLIERLDPRIDAVANRIRKIPEERAPIGALLLIDAGPREMHDAHHFPSCPSQRDTVLTYGGRIFCFRPKSISAFYSLHATNGEAN